MRQRKHGKETLQQKIAHLRGVLDSQCEELEDFKLMVGYKYKRLDETAKKINDLENKLLIKLKRV